MSHHPVITITEDPSYEAVQLQNQKRRICRLYKQCLNLMETQKAKGIPVSPQLIQQQIALLAGFLCILRDQEMQSERLCLQLSDFMMLPSDDIRNASLRFR